MTNQSTVPHTEVGLRLTICSEFLLNEQKPIEEVYGSWMRRVGGRLIEFAEFEYWYRRFKNNQFDLGYDTSLDSKAISEVQNSINLEAGRVQDVRTMIIEKEASVKVVEKNMEESKLKHQFKEENVPQDFHTIINHLSKQLGIERIGVYFSEKGCTIYVDFYEIHWKREENDWFICYPINDTVIETDDPEKSIVVHFWFLLGIPNIKFSCLELFGEKNQELKLKNRNSKEINSEKMNTLLQSMFNTFDHQIQAIYVKCDGFNEDTFLSMLKHVKPGTLKNILFDISWKEEGNYQKMKEIVKLDQWKRAKQIGPRGVTPWKVDDLLHCEWFSLQLDRITPEDVLRVTEHFFNSVERKFCHLYSKNECVDIEAIMNVLRSQNDGTQITEFRSSRDDFRFKLVKPTKCIELDGNKHCIDIQNYSKF